MDIVCDWFKILIIQVESHLANKKQLGILK